MLLFSEYHSIINSCRQKCSQGECTLSECNNCSTIHIAYFLKNYRDPTRREIEQILTKKNYSE